VNRRPGVLAFLSLLPSLAFAAPGDPIDLQVRFPHYHASTSLDEQGRAVESRQWSRIILKESALESAKTAAISFSTSTQKGEILEAYTLKPDGRRIDAPKDNYQLVVNRGQGGNSPVYSDRTSLSVVFPEVAVGDTEVFSFRITQTEPLFPGKFSITELYGTQAAYDDVRVSIDYPASLTAQYGSHGMEQTIADGADGRKTVSWRWANPNPVQEEREDWSIVDVDQQIHYSFSTFASYADIAAAYGERATPKAAVTERVQKLSDEIAGKAGTPREQARLLYEWVVGNISYAGNCIGIGAVVPRDLPFVLDNKIGDCKDHATLLQALLAARGIVSTQALINAGSGYSLPTVPVVSTVNHVINYIPSLDLYLDATSDTTPFGRLPHGDQGKPVLLVDGFRADSRTPVAESEANSEVIRSVMTVGADGSVTGTTEVVQAGDGAAATRDWARNLTRNVEDDLVRNMFRQQNLIGNGTFTKDDPTARSETYRYGFNYSVEKYIRLPGAGAFYVAPPVGGVSVGKFLQFTDQAEKAADVACRGGVGRDELEIRFPKGLTVLAVPDDVRGSNARVAYEATYRLKGNVLTIKRELMDKTIGTVCSPELVAEYKKIGDLVMDDMRSQVLYKLPKPKVR